MKWQTKQEIKFFFELIGLTAFFLYVIHAPYIIQAAASFELFQDACGVGIHSPLYGGFYLETVKNCEGF